MAEYGFVYVLGNQSMPGVHKIGRTGKPPSARCAELSNSTSVPEDFDVLMFLETDDQAQLERHMHDVFATDRVSPNREFFKVDLREIYKEFEKWATEGCILALSHTAEGLMACMDYDDQKMLIKPVAEVI